MCAYVDQNREDTLNQEKQEKNTLQRQSLNCNTGAPVRLKPFLQLLRNGFTVLESESILTKRTWASDDIT